MWSGLKVGIVMKCISCGSPHFVKLDNDIYRCEYCEETFQETPKSNSVSSVNKSGFPYENLVKKIIHLVGSSGSGTGFIIHQEGYVLTNHHVIDDLEILSGYILNQPEKIELEVVADGSMMGLDLALLKMIDPPKFIKGIPFSKKPFVIGETVYTIGNPKDLGTSLSKGSISRLDEKTLQCDLTVNPGNSGGPVLNEDGECIGVISYKKEDVEGYAFAVPISQIKSFLYKLKDLF